MRFRLELRKAILETDCKYNFVVADYSGRRPKRSDVARLAGVSDALVSYVVNNGPRQVAPTTRDRIVAAIQQLDYSPNFSARSLRLQSTGSFGLVVPNIANPYFSELAQALRSECARYGKTLVITESEEDARPASNVSVRALLRSQVDGIVDCDPQVGESLSALEAGGIPAVSLDSAVKNPRIPTVGIDYYQAAKEAVRHLIGHGHTRVGHISGPAKSTPPRLREIGWRDALSEAGLPAPKDLICAAPFSAQGGFDAVTKLASLPDPPTALFIATDIHTVGALSACYALDLRVPEDLAVFGFDGTQGMKFTTPPTSTVQQPIAKLAANALRVLMTPMPVDAPAEKVIVPFSLALRASCGCSGDTVYIPPGEVGPLETNES